jgi:hypothetical protein
VLRVEGEEEMIFSAIEVHLGRPDSGHVDVAPKFRTRLENKLRALPRFQILARVRAHTGAARRGDDDVLLRSFIDEHARVAHPHVGEL